MKYMPLNQHGQIKLQWIFLCSESPIDFGSKIINLEKNELLEM